MPTAGWHFSVKINHMTGIYKIENRITGCIYIGSSKYINTRKRHHFSELSRNKHRNIYLQRAYNKYGKAVFDFAILEMCSESDLVDREQYWLDLAQHEETSLYNLDKVAARPIQPSNRRYWLGKKRSKSDVQKFITSHIGLIGIKRCDNKTGYPGVERLRDNYYRARLTVNHKTTELGCYKTLQEAVKARQTAEKTFPGIKHDRLFS